MLYFFFFFRVGKAAAAAAASFQVDAAVGADETDLIKIEDDFVLDSEIR